LDLTWCFQPSVEFSITQNSGDLKLLEAFNQYFDAKGSGVYDKKDGVHVYMVRNIISISSIIIPFFVLYPLLGTKSYEFEKFTNLVKLISSKSHIGKELKNRDAFLEMALICKDLNSKMVNPKKLARLDLIIEWLKDLQTVPTLDQKLEFKAKLETELKGLKRSTKA